MTVCVFGHQSNSEPSTVPNESQQKAGRRVHSNETVAPKIAHWNKQVQVHHHARREEEKRSNINQS